MYVHQWLYFLHVRIRSALIPFTGVNKDAVAFFSNAIADLRIRLQFRKSCLLSGTFCDENMEAIRNLKLLQRGYSSFLNEVDYYENHIL